ncbi:hypothetical protein [Frigoriglobus tundricola]|uniref:Uncharacterized protein n=1 Tax=Frigoriglobus tundricola TaxID=2774151 RepID=A0A6M5YQF5_9BACT|nr:hypothetical protein [Frigoriglobus tundricola]QJW95471.1 hypothetical protein FTUN_3020 [Frigoriglobus tundricola]
MRPFRPSRLAALCGVCLFLFGSPASARAGDYDFVGEVIFTNIQNGLGFGEDVPYFGIGTSALTGPSVQFGSIRPTSKPTPVDLTTVKFTGEVGPNPFLPCGDLVHVVATEDGLIFCTWTATFTIQFVSATEVIFSGDGEFTVTGGTGKYKNASGRFRTLFATGTIPATSDSALAGVTQKGKIKR